MKTALSSLLAYSLLLFNPLSAAAIDQVADAALGLWWNQEQDAKIEIVRCGDGICGTVRWLKEPDYPAGSREGTPGTPKLDHHNADERLRTVPVIGLTIMRGFVYAGNGRWSGGTVYDPKNGKTYRGSIELLSPTRLSLRGYIGIPLIGRTAIWTRDQTGVK